jgi:hypothetical protein
MNHVLAGFSTKQRKSKRSLLAAIALHELSGSISPKHKSDTLGVSSSHQAQQVVLCLAFHPRE